ncbi:hypothetical protein N566_05490 [Streptomycetaceae bacterium MP113-05]|nr:hypothetical protein N566_05490 [Streptomycetaceae bacterium MP113-05]
MRRTAVLALALSAVLLVTVPASASPAGASGTAPGAVYADTGLRNGGRSGGGWEPAPSAPWNMPAGARCDFAVHGEAVVDEVVQRVLQTHPDGSPKLVAYQGALVVRVTNIATGAYHDADAGGAALVEYRLDGSQFWHVLGPVLVGFAPHKGNMPRGLYIVDGAYVIDIGADGYKRVEIAQATTTDLCALVD